MSFIVDYDGVMVNSCLPLNRYGLQGDLALIDQLVQSINKESEHVHINKQQIKNCKKRIGTLYNVLRQLPNPRPTPQILCVIRSADFLIKQMRYDGVWEENLYENLTCRDKFTALRERLRAVWSMHSSANWDSEDKDAESIDEAYAARSFIDLFHPTRADIRPDDPCAHHRPTGRGGEGERSGRVAAEDRTPATVEDVMELHRRRSRCAWRLAFEELEAVSGAVHRVVIPAAHPRSREPFDEAAGRSATQRHGAHSAPPLATRFAVWCGFTYRNHVVVVKELSGVGSLLSPQTSANFVEDAVVRTRWCHPDLVTYYGAYTEKLAPPPSVAGGDRPDSWRAALGLIMEDLTAVAVAGRRPGERSHGAAALYYPDEMDEETTSGEEEAEAEKGGGGDGGAVIPRYHTLHSILFTRRHRFTVLDSIDITLQLADVLQYILLDADHVSLDVCTAWIAVAPSNVYVAHLTPTATLEAKPPAGGGSAHKPRAQADNGHDNSNSNSNSNNNSSNSNNNNKNFTSTASACASLPLVLMEHKPITEVLMPHMSLTRFEEYASHSHHHHHHHPPSPVVVAMSGRPRHVSSDAAATAAHTHDDHTMSDAESTHHSDYYSSSIRRSRAAEHAATESTTSPPSHGRDAASANTSLTTSFIPVIIRGTYVIKYSPPLYIHGGPCSRWRPHPYAQSPACYALAQMLLALLTNTPPYPHCRTQSELRAALGGGGAMRDCSHNWRLVGGSATRHSRVAATTTTTSLSSYQEHTAASAPPPPSSSATAAATAGYASLPAALPPSLSNFLHRALALQCPAGIAAGAGGSSAGSKPMTLMDLRETLWNVRDAVRASGMTVLPLAETSHRSSSPVQSAAGAPHRASARNRLSKTHGRLQEEEEEDSRSYAVEMAVVSPVGVGVEVDLDDYGEI